MTAGRTWLLVVIGCSASAFTAQLISMPGIREARSKAKKLDEACRNVQHALRARASVLDGTSPSETLLRARIVEDAPNDESTRLCVEFPYDQWLACPNDSCRAVVLRQLSMEIEP